MTEKDAAAFINMTLGLSPVNDLGYRWLRIFTHLGMFKPEPEQEKSEDYYVNQLFAGDVVLTKTYVRKFLERNKLKIVEKD